MGICYAVGTWDLCGTAPDIIVERQNTFHFDKKWRTPLYFYHLPLFLSSTRLYRSFIVFDPKTEYTEEQMFPC